MNKKVGIITYHFALNYGAVLQCYALKEYLSSQGYDVIVLNYVTDKQKKNNGLLKPINNLKSILINIFLLPFYKNRKIKYKKFLKFNEKYLNLSIPLNNMEDLKKYIENNKIDYIISGSDQVWNPNIEDFDAAFFFPKKVHAKKIAYAASIGNASIDTLKKYSSFIKDFSLISLREKSSIKIIEKITNKKIYSVCDPVLLMTKDEWNKKFVRDNNCKKYLLCYFLHKENFKKEFRVVKQIAKLKNLQIKIINARYSKYSFKKGTMFSVGPDEFVNLFSNADFICTDSFHGTIFSIIFKKHFFTFSENSCSKDKRREEILNMLNMNNCLIYCNENININKISNSKISNSNDIEYNELDNYINDSKKFLGELNETNIKV